MNQLKPMYWGKLNGRPGPSHVRELLPMVSMPCPSGNGVNAPVCDSRRAEGDAPMQRGQDKDKPKKTRAEISRDWRARQKKMDRGE